MNIISWNTYLIELFRNFYTSFLQIMAVWLYYHELYKLVDHVSFHLFGANSFWLLTASISLIK